MSEDRPSTLERLWQTRAGLMAMVIIQPIGFRNGYIRLPDELAARFPQGMTVDQAYDALNVDVHGGITFPPGPYPADQLDNGDGVPDGTWIGWDYAHFTDAPVPEMWLAASGGGRPWPIQGHVWTTEEVAKQCEDVAVQIAAMAVAAGVTEETT